MARKITGAIPRGVLRWLPRWIPTEISQRTRRAITERNPSQIIRNHTRKEILKTTLDLNIGTFIRLNKRISCTKSCPQAPYCRQLVIRQPDGELCWKRWRSFCYSEHVRFPEIHWWNSQDAPKQLPEKTFNPFSLKPCTEIFYDL